MKDKLNIIRRLFIAFKTEFKAELIILATLFIFAVVVWKLTIGTPPPIRSTKDALVTDKECVSISGSGRLRWVVIFRLEDNQKYYNVSVDLEKWAAISKGDKIKVHFSTSQGLVKRTSPEDIN